MLLIYFFILNKKYNYESHSQLLNIIKYNKYHVH